MNEYCVVCTLVEQSTKKMTGLQSIIIIKNKVPNEIIKNNNKHAKGVYTIMKLPV